MEDSLEIVIKETEIRNNTSGISTKFFIIFYN